MFTFIRPPQRLFLALSMCWLCVYATPTLAQDPSLSSALDAYLACVKVKDFNCVLDQTHPSIFKMVPKETLQEKLKEQTEEEGMETRIENVKLTNVGKVIEKDGGRYARVDYTSRLVMKLTDNKNEDGTTMTAEEIKEADAFMLEMFEGVYGKDKVKYNAAERVFTIDQEESMYAIREPATTEWTFIKTGTEKLLEGSVPDEVLKKLKK